MNVVFRVDASVQIGIGHVMRCLTLAKSLKRHKVTVKFICRKHHGNLIDEIKLQGFEVFELKFLDTCDIDRSSNYSHWLGVTQQQDSNECVDFFQFKEIDWMVIDHYSIDEVWQKELKPYYKNLMVIDDLANRKHLCDILLDQTFGRNKNEYTKLVPKFCKLLLGSYYSLLRPEFENWRGFSLNRRKNFKFNNILVSMGGIDSDNITEKILDSIACCDLPDNIGITVVMGKMSPNIESVKRKSYALRYKVKIKIGVDNMAEIMSKSDIAIGASGSTTWGRCCLGLPTIQISIAENQEHIVKNLNDVKVVKIIKDVSQLKDSIPAVIKSSVKMSLASSSIVNGEGVNKVVNFIFFKDKYADLFSIRPARENDSDFVYRTQTKETRKYYLNPEVPTIGKHTKWFLYIMSSLTSQLFIITFGHQNAGVLRVDNIKHNEISVSIAILSNYRGKGIARIALLDLEKLIPGRVLKATIHKDNLFSNNLFLKLGYKIIKYNENFVEYIKHC